MAWVTPGYNGGYPYPYPQNPYPTSTGTGYHGYGSGVKGQKPVRDTVEIQVNGGGEGVPPPAGIEIEVNRDGGGVLPLKSR
jgi:hypothetical protein